MNVQRIKKNRILFGAVMGIALVYLALSIFFMERFFPGTQINGEDCGLLHVSEVEQWIFSQAEVYTLELSERGGGTEQLTMKDLGGYFEPHHQVLKAKRQQNGFLWPRMLWSRDSYEVYPEPVFEEEAFWQGLEALDCIQKEIAPRDAGIVFTDTGYRVLEEARGLKLDREAFAETIRQAFARLEPRVDLEEKGCYVEPAIYSDTQEFQEMTEQLDVWFSAQVTYEIGEKPLVVDARQIQEWILLSEAEGKAELQTEKIADYINILADAYDEESTKRVFYSTNRGRIVLTDRRHQWLIDREAEIAALTACIQEGGKIHREPYYQVPEGPSMGSEIGDTYVEVDMGAQHLWVYREGKMVLETDVVTGNTGLRRGTPGILAYVYSKERNRILRGEDYESFVRYWVPFYRGYGIHDASWRGNFGGSIYKTNGSHGCVNIPPSVMPSLFEHVELGMPVITYY
ncbi:MAG: L,D-transpeptidase family protein [Lachnospiraceae bacterium]|nr:L,D-transpeptidase family protein [Lachnospiraceae bacterium]